MYTRTCYPAYFPVPVEDSYYSVAQKDDELQKIEDEMELFLAEKASRETPMLSDVPIMDSGAAGTVCPKEYAKHVARRWSPGTRRRSGPRWATETRP